jgi:dipeptidyl aminopeptidase/acylaminoacyl peptidase
MLHGGSDERVPIGQPMEYYPQPSRTAGRIVELVFYPREGHGLSEFYHQIDKVRREYDWITQYTLGDPPKVMQ